MIRVSPFLANPILLLLSYVHRLSVIHPSTQRRLYPQRRLFDHLLATILRQHPPHLALKDRSTHQFNAQLERLARAFTPSCSPFPMFEYDPRNVFNHFSPAQFQQLLASIAFQNLSDPIITSSASPVVSPVNPIAANLKNAESTPCLQQAFDFTQLTSNFGYPFIAPESYKPSTTSPNTTGANAALLILET